MNFVRSLVLLGGLCSVAIGEIASISALSSDPIQQKNFFETLSQEELVVITDMQLIEDDVINLLNEHLQVELAAGKARSDVVAELKNVINKAPGTTLTNTEKAVLICLGIGSLVGGIYLTKFIYDKLTAKSMHGKPKPIKPPKVGIKPQVKPNVANEKLDVAVNLEKENDADDDIKSESSAGFSDDELDLLDKPGTAKRPRRPRR